MSLPKTARAAVDTVSIGGGPRDLFPDPAKEKPKRLGRWEYIRAAEMFDEKLIRRPRLELRLGA